MTYFLSVEEILWIHESAIQEQGGGKGILNPGAVESAASQPQMSFGGQELYPTLFAKAAALGFSLVKNHAFVDGNKRVGFAAMKTFLLLNDCRFECTLVDGEAAVLAVAAGTMTREQLVEWIRARCDPKVMPNE